MSLSVPRRKSRRKLHRMAKNIDYVLFPQYTSSILNNAKYNRSDHRRSANCQSGLKPQKHTNSSPASSNSSSSFSTVPLSWSRYRKNVSLENETKTTISGIQENDLDLESISFRIGSITYEMDDIGNWSCSPKDCLILNKETIAELTERSNMLAQENNMLRVKNELLTDMIARKNVRKEKIEKELDRLRKLLSTSSSRFSNTDSVPDKK